MDDRLTDAELDGLERESRESRLYTISVDDVRRLVAEVRRLRAFRASVETAMRENSFPEDREEAIAALLLE